MQSEGAGESKMRRHLKTGEHNVRKKTRRYNSAQIAEMVDYMSTHSDLASGSFSCAMGNVVLDRQWEALAKILEEHGSKKTAESEEQPIGEVDILFPLPSEFEWVQNETEDNIEPQAGPSVQMDPTPTFQAKDPSESPGNSHPSSSRKRKRHTDVEELESAVKLFQGIQQDHNNSIKEMANAINRLASAQEKLLVQQQTSATILETAVAAQLESNRLQ
uniref:Uncharacterized protein n=1 Tax=Timema douglasi TaxID=61478 RepID=A0A7R8VLK7_TIMDO|nr:unnamed protein product [Timema douglasi]